MTDDWLSDTPEGQPGNIYPGDAVPGAEREASGTGSPTPTVPADLIADLMALLNEPVAPHPEPRVQQVRRVSRRAYLPWSAREDQLLLRLFEAGFGMVDLSGTFCRQPGAIQSRLTRLLEGKEVRYRDPEKLEARRLERQQRRQERRERREQAAQSKAGKPVTRVPLELMGTHFPAWLALVKAGSRIEVLEADQVVAVLQQPESRA